MAGQPCDSNDPMNGTTEFCCSGGCDTNQISMLATCCQTPHEPCDPNDPMGVTDQYCCIGTCKQDAVTKLTTCEQ